MENKCILCKNKAERDAVLAKLEEQGYAWCSGKKPTKWSSQFWDDDDAVAICIGKFGTHSVSWVSATDSYVENHKDNAITASKFLRNNTRPILITRKGRVVTAENKNTGEKAIATCSPDDAFDFGTGAMIAVARLIAQSDKGITKDAETVLRQLLGDDVNNDSPAEAEPTGTFKIGDIVTLKDGLEVDVVYGGLTLLKNMYDRRYGKPLEVLSVDTTGNFRCAPVGGGMAYWYSKEMLEPWDESKIREGDIVRVINTGLNYSTYPQWVGEHISDPDMAARYCFGSPSDEGNYKVIKIAEHESNGRTLAYIEQCDGFIFNKCYLVEVKGLEKVTE